jgi:outer membrane protein TolC
MLAAAGSASAQQTPTPATVPAPPLSLAECLQLAAQRQPALAAARASLAAAEDNSQALDTLRAPGFLAPDLPYRRQQAAVGVTAAAGGLDRAERDTVYAVTRTYFTVLYAREQERVARGVVDRLKALADIVRTQVKAGAPNVTQRDVDRTTVYLDLAAAKQVQAAEGAQRGLAALREAIGLGPDCPLDLPEGRLPEPDGHPCLPELIAAALARRGDLIQASSFVELTSLEIEAQGTSCRAKMPTFASVGDIHARQVPEAQRGTNYAPGGIPPEMPTTLVGYRTERVKRAEAFHDRAVAVVAKTRDLIALQVEDAFRRWQEAAGEAARAREAATTGARLSDGLRRDYITGQNVKVEELINAYVLESQAQSQYNEFLFNEIVALADLERVTAGGFCAGLAGPAPMAEQKGGSGAAPAAPGAR